MGSPSKPHLISVDLIFSGPFSFVISYLNLNLYSVTILCLFLIATISGALLLKLYKKLPFTLPKAETEGRLKDCATIFL
jgi:hypothetical protein